jgi:hypothetical protein
MYPYGRTLSDDPSAKVLGTLFLASPAKVSVMYAMAAAKAAKVAWDNANPGTKPTTAEAQLLTVFALILSQESPTNFEQFADKVFHHKDLLDALTSGKGEVFVPAVFQNASVEIHATDPVSPVQSYAPTSQDLIFYVNSIIVAFAKLAGMMSGQSQGDPTAVVEVYPPNPSQGPGSGNDTKDAVGGAVNGALNDVAKQAASKIRTGLLIGGGVIAAGVIVTGIVLFSRSKNKG